MARGLFITFEGGEGAGKSTQVLRLADSISSLGREVVRTREPGGSPGAESIRELLVSGPADRWSAMTETLLVYAARRDHAERLISPALHRGAVVVCDRFADSTRAYQGAAGGAPEALIAALEEAVLAGAWPDLTIVLDLPVEVGLRRAAARAAGETRFESKSLDFHRRLRSFFRSLVQSEPGRCKLIDADRPEELVERDVWGAAARLLENT